MKDDSFVKIAKALADPTRRRMLAELRGAGGGGLTCSCMCARFPLSQPTISHHLKLLHESGILDREKRGVWVYYRVNRDALRDLATLLGGVTA